MISLKTWAAFWVRFTSSSRSEATAVRLAIAIRVVTAKMRFNIVFSIQNSNSLKSTNWLRWGAELRHVLPSASRSNAHQCELDSSRRYPSLRPAAALNKSLGVTNGPLLINSEQRSTRFNNNDFFARER